MSVFWLIPAQDQLQDALDQSTPPPPYKLQELQKELSDALRDTFKQADAIIVIERINGYSPGMKNHVFRVEYVDQTGESKAAIVKFANGDKLASELAGWRSCERLSNSRGVVLMPLRLGVLGADNLPCTIVYEDAKQRLRAARLINLEDVALSCCRWNDPECVSVEHVLDEVFVELRQHLYQRARAVNDPAKLADDLLGRLQKGLGSWKSPHSQQEDCHETVMSVLPGSVLDLIDPLDYLPTLLARRRHLPEVMRGCAHGDLHGRNILVGTDRETATFAAVFDYEDMGAELLVAWDFAKLETELKVRAYEKVFPGEETDFIHNVHEFEQRLARHTLECSKSPTWRPASARETPAERLFALLIALRGRARESLAFQPKRSHSWLHEYFFLLAAYGLYAGRFSETYGRRQFLGAFISAAAASEQHAWAKNVGADVTQRAAASAKLAIQQNAINTRPDVAAAESFHVPFAFAKEYSRSRRQEFVQAGAEILTTLRDRFPYVLEIWQELCLAYLELLDLTRDEKYKFEAKRVLTELDTKYPRRRHYETLCRHGRLWKDCGDFSFDQGDDATAATDYQQSISQYLLAYQQTGHYYPGINVATLYLLAGQPGPSANLAREILADLDQRHPVPDDDLTWVLATKGEANLLLGNCDDAMLQYEQAVKRPDCQPHYRSAMLKQVNRILRMKPCADANVEAGRFEAIFR